eukprot:10963236-Lingulodinium_polyedra.AAC.1
MPPGSCCPHWQRPALPGATRSSRSLLRIVAAASAMLHRVQACGQWRFRSRRTALAARLRTGPKGSAAADTISRSCAWSLPHVRPGGLAA